MKGQQAMATNAEAAPAGAAAATRQTTSGPTRTLARFVTDTEFADLPAPVVSKAKNLLVDYLGCLVTTTKENMAQILFSVAATEGVSGVPEASATIAGLKGRYTTEWAAFVNGANTHLSELDDTHRLTAAHSGLGLFATAIAGAERTHPTGEEFLTAVVIGYEVALRIAMSVMPDHYLKGWNPSGTATMFGCAAVAAKLLRLSEEQTAWALGLAGVQAAGNRAHLTERVMTKDFNNGHAARCGINAGLLARAGFTASTDELENVMGFWALYGAGSIRETEATRDLRSHWRILEVGHKPYPSCRFVHSSLDATVDLAARGALDPSTVRAMHTTMSATGRYIVDDPEPWTEGKGTMGPRFSAQFNIAVAALYGRKGLEDIFDPERARAYLGRSEVRDLMAKIMVYGDPAIDQNPDDFWKCDLSVTAADGTVTKMTVKYPLGEPENDLGTTGLIERFVKITTMAGFWTEEQARDAAAKLLSIDSAQDAAAIAALYA
jgi:2-methylcitrate dehydratase PrpD